MLFSLKKMQAMCGMVFSQSCIEDCLIWTKLLSSSRAKKRLRVSLACHLALSGQPLSLPRFKAPKQWFWMSDRSQSLSIQNYNSVQLLTLYHTSGHIKYLFLSGELLRWGSWGAGILNLMKLHQLVNGWSGIWINVGLIPKFVIFLLRTNSFWQYLRET